MFGKAQVFPVSLLEFTDIYMPVLEVLTTPVVIIEFSSSNKIILSNKLAEQLFVCDKQQLANCSILDLFEEETAKQYVKDTSIYSTSERCDCYGKTQHGEIFALDYTVSPLVIDNKQYLLVGFKDLTAIKEYKSSLQAQNLALLAERELAESSKQYIQTQAVFIDTLCHELRNPLNGIVHGVDILQDAIEILQKKSITTQEQDAILADMMNNIGIIHTCIKQQKGIVDDVLTISKLENGKIELIIKPFDLTEAIQDVVKMFSENIEQKKIILNLDIPPGPLWLKGDPNQLMQVISNILANAIKFTEHGSITIVINTELCCPPIDAEDAEIIAYFCIKDTGVGMSPQEISSLFEQFGQGKIATGKEYNGSGLGLVISKKIIELMKGNIAIESTKWSGTTCSFQIVCQQLTEQEQIRAIANKSLIRNVAKQTLLDLSEKNILIVEDNIINMKILCSLLEPTRACIHQAFDGEAALEMFVTHHFDLVFMDIGLPKIGGLEVTRKIREREQVFGGHTPIVGLSGFTREDTKKKALCQSSMDEYLTKPYEKSKILEIISKYVVSSSVVSPQLYFTENFSFKDTQERSLQQKTNISTVNSPTLEPVRRKKCLIS